MLYYSYNFLKLNNIMFQLKEFLEWQKNNNSDIRIDDDYMNFISDTLFSTVTSNHRIFEFPNAREGM